jgi:HK97 family phage prohead protease
MPNQTVPVVGSPDSRDIPNEVRSRLINKFGADVFERRDNGLFTRTAGGTVADARLGGRIEARATAGSKTIEGYGTTWDSSYGVYGGPPYGWSESVARGATIGADMEECYLLADHDGMPLGSVAAGTLTVDEDDEGLRFVAEIDTYDEYSMAVWRRVQRGEFARCSWAFRVADGGSTWSPDYMDRTITRVDTVFDVSVVKHPANPATSVSARAGSSTVLDLAARDTGTVRRRRAGRTVLPGLPDAVLTRTGHDLADLVCERGSDTGPVLVEARTGPLVGARVTDDGDRVTLTAYPLTYRTSTQVGGEDTGWSETFAGKACARTVAAKSDRFLRVAGQVLPVARSEDDTLTFESDSVGLRMTAVFAQPVSGEVDALLMAVQRGDATAVVEFTPLQFVWDTGHRSRSVTEIRLHDVRLVVPGSEGTDNVLDGVRELVSAAGEVDPEPVRRRPLPDAQAVTVDRVTALDMINLL